MKFNQIKAGAILTYLTMGLGVIISLIYTPIMLRMIPQGEYGIYTIALSIIGYLSILSFGINSTYVRFFFTEKQSGGDKAIRNLNGCFLLINSLISLIVIAAGIVVVIFAPDFFRKTFTETELLISRQLLVILLVNLAISFPFSVFSSYATAHEKFILLKLVNLIRTVTSPFIGLVALSMGYGSVGMVTVTVVINILTELYIVFYCFVKLAFRAGVEKIKVAFFKNIFVFSFFVFIQSITDQINWSLDSIVLGKVSGSVTVAIYGLASQLNGYFRQFSTAITSVYAPKVNRLVSSGASNDEITSMYTRVSRLQFMITVYVLTGFILWGQFFVKKWGGVEYEGSYLVAVILMLAITPAMFMNVGMEIRRAMNKHKVPAIAMLCTSLINLVITIPMSKWYGAVGAALATLIASYLNASFLIFYYQKSIGLNMFKYMGSILKLIPTTLVAAVCGYGLTRLISVNSYLMLVVSAILFSIVYWLLHYFLSFDSVEKEYIRRKKL